jgi:hypothetical protein
LIGHKHSDGLWISRQWLQTDGLAPSLELLPIAAIGSPSTLGSALTGVSASSSESSVELNLG